MVPAVSEVAVAIPSDLRHIGEQVLASSTGPADAPAIVLLGGISADRRVTGPHGWWSGLAGAGRPIDTERWRVIGLDFAADESGAVAPSTIDQARVLVAALDTFGISRARAVVGASYGGMVGLALAEHFPDRVEALVAISAPAAPHPSATAARELQRRVVALGIAAGRGDEALAIARGMAMTTYRTPAEFAARFEGGIPCSNPLGQSAPGAYLHARGAAYPAVMSPGRFLSLSASIDRHRSDPSRIGAPTLVLGCDSDQLVLADQLRSLAAALPNATLDLSECLYGHDMFLKEAEAVGGRIAAFLDTQ